MVKTTRQEPVQYCLTDMAERRVAEIVAERGSFDQVLVEI